MSHDGHCAGRRTTIHADMDGRAINVYAASRPHGMDAKGVTTSGKLRIHPGLQSHVLGVQPLHLTNKAANNVPQLGERESLQRCCIRQRHAGCESRLRPQRNHLARESALVTRSTSPVAALYPG